MRASRPMMSCVNCSASAGTPEPGLTVGVDTSSWIQYQSPALPRERSTLFSIDETGHRSPPLPAMEPMRKWRNRMMK